MSKKMTTEEFIEKARKVHGDKYDYSKVEYKGSKIEVCIICPIHGEFLLSPNNHLSQKQGCKLCGIEKRSKKRLKPVEQFIAEAREVHGNKYDYSKVVYRGRAKPVIITCPKHGDFERRPVDHLNGEGCKYCSYEKLSEERRKPLEQFILEAKEVHGTKYVYDKVNYINNYTEVTVTCPTHGDFDVAPYQLLRGEGCPFCNQSHLEGEIQVALTDKGIEFEYNQKYEFLNNLQLDFYIPSMKIAIECQGLQHFEPVKHFGGEERYQRTVKNDKMKAALCEKEGIKLLYFSNLHIDYPYKVYENKDELLKEILT